MVQPTFGLQVLRSIQAFTRIIKSFKFVQLCLKLSQICPRFSKLLNSFETLTNLFQTHWFSQGRLRIRNTLWSTFRLALKILKGFLRLCKVQVNLFTCSGLLDLYNILKHSSKQYFSRFGQDYFKPLRDLVDRLRCC